MAADVGLPAGFTLDESAAPSDASGLPAGFSMDDTPAATPPQRSVGQALKEETIAGAHGAEREGMGLGNIVGLGKLGVPGTSNADLQAFDKQHAAEFANNKAGKLVGESAPWLAAQFIPGVDVGADTAGLGGGALRATMAALQGAGQGAASAPVGQQGSAALTGAATGGALSGAGSALTRGLISKTPEAQALVDASGGKAFVPIAQGAASPVARAAYGKALPMVDIFSQLKGQAAALPKAFKAAVAPKYTQALDQWTTKGLPYTPGAGQTIDPADLEQQVLQRIHAETPDMPNSTADKVAANARSLLSTNVDNPMGLTGNTLQRTYQALGGATGKSRGTVASRAYQSARGVVDDYRKAGLPPDAADQLSSLDDAYRGLRDVTANKTASHGWWAPLEAGGAAAGAIAGHPLPAALMALANLAATKTAQKGLYGDLGAQVAARSPLAQTLGALGRQLTVGDATGQ